jgi:hypothetical protein
MKIIIIYYSEIRVDIQILRHRLSHIAKLQFEYNITLIRLFLNDLYYFLMPYFEALTYILKHLNFILEIKYVHSKLIKTYAFAIRMFSQTFRNSQITYFFGYSNLTESDKCVIYPDSILNWC